MGVQSGESKEEEVTGFVRVPRASATANIKFTGHR